MKLPFYSKYPYLVNLKEYLENYFGIPPRLEYFLEIKEYKDRTLDRAIRALKNIGYKPSTNELLEVVTFYLSAVLAGYADPWALRKFADYESKRAYRFLIAESENIVASVGRKLSLALNILITSNNTCGYRIALGSDPRSGTELIECYPFSIKVPTYLKLTSKLSTDQKWKLVNRIISRGEVFLNKRDTVRLIEEAVKKRVVECGVSLLNEVSGDSINELASEIRKVVRQVRGFTSDEERELPLSMKGKIIEEFFPPCIQNIKESLLRGEHLSHHQRFALATFLLNIGASVDYVLDLFKHSPDYNERIARYQIEHLAGMRGSRKKYLVYSCEKMRTLGMCVANCGTKTPVQYYIMKIKSLKNQKR